MLESARLNDGVTSEPLQKVVKSNLYHLAFASFFLLVLNVTSLAETPTFWSWAQRPIMGWNSWDFYGTSINEASAKAQTDYMATNLLSHGWNLITVNIQWGSCPD